MFFFAFICLLNKMFGTKQKSKAYNPKQKLFIIHHLGIFRFVHNMSSNVHCEMFVCTLLQSNKLYEIHKLLCSLSQLFFTVLYL